MDRRTVDLLVCPVTKTALVYLEPQGELISCAAGLAYPVLDNIPVMLADKARRLSAGEMTRLKSSPHGPSRGHEVLP